MPIPPVTVDYDSVPWSGKDDPFSTVDQRSALDQGAPFYILDAKTGMRDRDGNPTQIGFLIETDGIQSERFVMTMKEDYGRLKLAKQAQEAAANDDCVGPCRIELIPARTEGYHPYKAISSAPDPEAEEAL